MERKAYPSDVSDAEWAFAAPYLSLMTEEAPQRDYPLREVFNGLRYLVRSGAAWRLMPHDLPPWYTVYQQTQRWLKAGVFEAMVHDLRAVLRVAQGRNPESSAVIFDGRTLQSSPESGEGVGYDGAKRKRGSKTHMAVDTLGHLLALLVTRSFAWAARFRRLARDYERLPETLAGLHFLAFAILMLIRFVELIAHSS
jgi:transposase